ncbi:TRAP transporter large permease [Roseovarius sp.]|uniref:TRAP transporter large permease n=1 Tax=Roseovarius sp. TaxID=1486281 RepID=UPI0026201070|nr:TRAP transporter large permease [Roseovarius sp.]MDM8165870.1 TRAP transporter large permease [Roseovarius sp.]
MTWVAFSALIIAMLFVLLASGVWIAIALMTTGMSGLYIAGGAKTLLSLGSISWNSINSFTLSPVPLFIVMGAIILRCGVAQRFYAALAIWLRFLPGGLLQSNVVSCSVFAAACGSSVATAGTIGTVTIPELKARGYDDRLIFGSLAAGGTLGILIPPSIIMIIYCSIVEVSVAKLFIAGVVPGLVLAVAFMGYIGVRCLLNPALAPTETEPVSMGDRFRSLGDILPLFGLIFFVMGSIYLGWATATEAAAIGVLASVIIAALYRGLSWENVKEAHLSAVRTTCMVLVIVVAAQVFSYALVYSGVSRSLTGWVIGLDLPVFVLFLAIVLLYIFLGCLIDGASMMLLTLPVLFPIINAAGFDLIWFGVMVVVLIEIGMITPPIGLNLFVLHGIGQGTPYADVARGALPYVCLMLAFLLLMWFVPGLALWLPDQMTVAR